MCFESVWMPGEEEVWPCRLLCLLGGVPQTEPTFFFKPGSVRITWRITLGHPPSLLLVISAEPWKKKVYTNLRTALQKWVGEDSNLVSFVTFQFSFGDLIKLPGCALLCPALPCPALPCPALPYPPKGTAYLSAAYFCVQASENRLYSAWFHVTKLSCNLQMCMHAGRLIGTHAHEVMSIMQHLMSNYDDEAGGEDGPVQVTMLWHLPVQVAMF